jgi:quercetin dioxygenase-like cupin family protein
MFVPDPAIPHPLEVHMRINEGIALGVLTLLLGCSDKPKSESAAVDTTNATSAAVAGESAPASREWGPAPQIFPAGAKIAVISGDPGKEGLFTVELSFPDGYKIPPHFHPTDEVVTVREGTFLVGMGDKIDPKKTKAMESGDSATVAAGMHHFGLARGATVVAVKAQGPFAMTYVNPADDPTKRGATQ